jgi:hypothetical protein
VRWQGQPRTDAPTVVTWSATGARRLSTRTPSTRSPPPTATATGRWAGAGLVGRCPAGDRGRIRTGVAGVPWQCGGQGVRTPSAPLIQVVR